MLPDDPPPDRTILPAVPPPAEPARTLTDPDEALLLGPVAMRTEPEAPTVDAPDTIDTTPEPCGDVAVCSTMAPDVDWLPPELTDRVPPVFNAAKPADNATAAPDPLVLEPARTEMLPALPLVADPVPSTAAPELPLDALPVLRPSPPDDPLLPALTDETVTLPLPAATLPPDKSEIEPPTPPPGAEEVPADNTTCPPVAPELELEPPETHTGAPTAVVDKPAVRLTAPARPEEACPDCTKTFPVPPLAEEPEPIET